MNKGTCKHFNGMGLEDDKCCDVGVNYRKHVGGTDFGWCTRAPCIRKSTSTIKPNGPINACSKYEEPSQADLDKYEAEMKEFDARIDLALPVIARIKREHKGKGAKGVVECPACGGKLHFTHAACNGHVWGKCETDKCLSWME